ncbi:MAG: hypothetical protein PHH59_16495 [Methylovulum sp.]|uniref:hypothetical protein n=1 Tax=Methylovulum sp. TaxID=1916980 RepID=UPI00260B3974|nr:hypothetical protein [Methylovulum sp.]MDD2725601.1 hypothetical protein [Methylovulum sp.]MDD5125654.1 hypothetical protein [Methylovulum sp.]
MCGKVTNTLLMVWLCVLSVPVSAEGDGATKNYCADPADKKEFEDLLGKNPTDKGIIRLFAIRQGLCDMIGKQQIPLETGMDLWAIERQKTMLERTQQRLNRLTKKML